MSPNLLASLVDIMAGAMARCMKWIIQGQKDNDDYAKELSSFLPESLGGVHTMAKSTCDARRFGDNWP